MPAVNVARTDTFEQQRQKINTISTQIFSISAGGSDLSTGVLKIGDGSLTSPSLSFSNEDGLGFFRPENKTLGITSTGKKLVNFTNEGLISFKDLITQKNIITDLVTSNAGSLYDAGSFQDVRLLGGTGENATANISVTEYIFTEDSRGSGYTYGIFDGSSLQGGSGNNDATLDITVVGVVASITNAGSGYLPGTYTSVPVGNVSSSGSSETATVVIGGTIDYNGSITNAGTAYDTEVYEGKTVFAANPKATYVVTAVDNTGTPPPNKVYSIDGNVQQALTLERGNTYRFDISDSTVDGHPLIFETTGSSTLDENYYQVVTSAVSNFIDFIIKPDAPIETIQYNCSLHNGMGAAISVIAGTDGIYGHGMTADIEVDSSNEIISFEIKTIGSDYKASDVLTSDIPSGSGFEYTLGTPVYQGSVDVINFNDLGTGYLQGDTLTVADSDLGGKGGSGFQCSVTSSPGAVDTFSFVSKGTGYQTGDVLILPDETSGVSVTVNGSIELEVQYTENSTTVAVSSTAALRVGMTMSGSADFEGTETITNINSGTSITVSAAPTADGDTIVTFSTLDPADQLAVSSTDGIYPEMEVTFTSGVGALPEAGTITVVEVNRVTDIVTLSEEAASPGTAVASFTPPYGANPTSDFQITVGVLGVIDAATVSNPGNGYEFQDILNINPVSLVAPQGFAVTNVATQKIDFTTTVSSTGWTSNNEVTNGTDNYSILFVSEIAGNLEYVILQESDFSESDTLNLVIGGNPTGADLTPNSITSGYRYLVDGVIAPSITMYSGDTYDFDVSNGSNSAHIFAFSAFPDGPYGPSNIPNVVVTTTASSANVSVPSTTGILAGMEVVITDGQGIIIGTTVSSVDNSTDLTLSNTSLISGSCTCTFRGVEYTNGVERLSGKVRFRPSADTPSPLYYYCKSLGSVHENEGGNDGYEVAMTVDQNNPRVFGSGAEFIVAQVTKENTILGDVETGTLTLTDIQTDTLTSDTLISTTSVTSATLESTTTVKTPTLEGTNDSSGLDVVSTLTTFNGSVNIGSTIVTNHVSGLIQSSGEIKTTSNLNVNDKLNLVDNEVSVSSTDDLLLTAFTGRVVKVTNNTAFVVPTGTDAERPTTYAQDGAIRFNTDTKQYEGYSQDTSTWSSLGGVRDLDGNTTILAELSIGANDNTLWFINDSVNSCKFTKNELSFESAKTIRSSNVSAPNYVDWVANVAFAVGVYVKYQNNIFEVMVAGTSATSGNPPLDTTGNTFVNGTSELRWTHLAVGPLVFDEIEELRVGPTGNVPLTVSGDLRFFSNTISTDVNDLIIRPNTGKKLVIDAVTSLAIPVGSDNDRGVSVQGSIRFNTTATLFEGYDGNNWGSLGGVKDVDQNTYIIPETSPGANENILYFFNDNNNTLRLSTTTLDFDTIDTVRSVTSDEFELTASLLTIDAAATTVDNTSTTKTFLHSAKQFFDIGISAGLTVDPIFRMDNQGDVQFNTGFGTGVFNGIKIYDKELKTTELTDVRTTTEDLSLVKGTFDNTGSNIYVSTNELSAKVILTAYNPTDGNKEFIEFGVIDDGTDVYFTEYGNLRTGGILIVPSFAYTENDEIRLNIAVGSGVSDTNTVNITVVSHVTKK